MSIEDSLGHCNDDELLKSKILVLGVINKAKSIVENVEEIEQKISHVLTIIPRERLMVVPD